MDHRVFLRDIDDWELYAKGLEAHVAGWHEQLEQLFDLFATASDDGWWFADKLEHFHEDVRRVVKEAADRHARLREADRFPEHQLDPDKP